MKIFFVFMYNYIHLNKNEMNINKQQALESFQFNITTVKRFTQQMKSTRKVLFSNKISQSVDKFHRTKKQDSLQ